MKNASTVLSGFVLALWASSVNAGPTAPPEKDRQGVIEARARLIHAMESDDLTALSAALTPDHVTMPPDGPALPNSQELRAWHEQRIAAWAIKGNWSSGDLQLQGDWAIDSWHGVTTLTPRTGGRPIEMMTKGVWFWRRGPDGTWKLARSIWNNDTQTSWAAPANSACDAAVGSWEYVAPANPGRATISKLADGRHLLVWIIQTSSGGGAPAAGAWEATCEGSRRHWRVVFSTDPAAIGGEVDEEFEVNGDTVRFWILGADGKRGQEGGARRLR